MKLILDISLSFFILIFFSPVIIVVSLLIFLIDGLPILYISKKLGKKNIIFNIYKFRTMKLNTKNDEITFFGKFLRRSSIDEIPQLLNILIGDMSIVGPRPLPIHILKKISKKNRLLRSSIKPGITGYSQIKYRGRKRTLKEKVDLDIIYIKNYNVSLYMYIIFLTPIVLIKRFLFNKKGTTL